MTDATAPVHRTRRQVDARNRRARQNRAFCRITPKGTQPQARPHYHRHRFVAVAHAPAGLPDDQAWERCLCGAHRSIPSEPEPESWWSWLAATMVLLHAWWTLTVRWARVPPLDLQSVPEATRRTWRALATCQRAVLLGVDAAHGWARAPREHEFTNRDGHRIYLIRTRRDGRPGWLSLTSGGKFGKFYPNITGASGLDRHWVGGNATWDATAGSKWSATNGGAGGSSVPDSGDNAFLDSGSGANTVTLGAGLTVTCRSFDCTGFTGTLAWGTGVMNVGDGSGGAFKLVSGMTVSGTATGAVQFVSSSTNGGTGWGITTAGKLMPNANFTPNAGKWVLQDAWSSSLQSITVSFGTFVGNGKSITCGSFSSANANVRTIDLTNCSVTCAGNSTSFNTSTATNLTFTATGSTITLTGTNASIAATSQTFGSLVMNAVGVANMTTSGCTFVNVTRTGTAAKTDGLTFSSATATIVTGTLTYAGNTVQGTNRLLVSSSTVGTQRTINCTGAAIVISGDVDFMDITHSGSPSWTNAGSAFVGDCGGNGTLITTNRTTPATQTATGTASFTWSTHGWTSRVPLPQDTVLIPNAFVAGRTITADMPRLGGSIDFSGCTGSPTWTNTVAQSIFGSLTLASGVTPSGANTLTLGGRTSQTITSAGATFTQAVVINAPSGTYTLQDAFIGSRANVALQVTLGTLVDNGQSVTLNAATGAGQFTMTNGTLTKTGAWSLGCTSAAIFWQVTGGTLTDSGSITLSAASTNTRTFAGGGKTYGTLTYTVAGSTGQLTISGSNTYSTINFSDVTNARTLAFTAGATTTITGAFNVNGTVGKLMTVTTASATTHSLVKSGGAVAVNYVSVSNSLASGAPFFAGTHSTDGGGNTGWTFTDPVITGAQATETDSANAGTPQATVAGAQATETDSANSGAPSALVAGAMASETDAANIGAPTARVTGALATETDAANPGATAASTSGARATETDTANVGAPTAAISGAQAVETDTANAGTPQATVSGTQATETDSANAGTPRASVIGAMASETDTANMGSLMLARAGSRANEIDTGNAGATTASAAGARATETDTGNVGTPTATVLGSRADELDTANAGTADLGNVVITGSRADEADSANSGAPIVALSGARATETDSGNSGSVAASLTGQRATETDTANTSTPAVITQGARATETDNANAGVVNARIVGVRALETDAALSGAPAVVIAGNKAQTADVGLPGLMLVSFAGTQATTSEFANGGALLVRLFGAIITELDSAFAGVGVGGAVSLGAEFNIEIDRRTFSVVVDRRSFKIVVERISSNVGLH